MTLVIDLPWARRLVRAPHGRQDAMQRRYIPKTWHIQNPAPDATGTYCGVNVLRYYSERAQAPITTPPDGEVCKRCLRQYDLGYVLPQGGGSSHRKG